MPFPAFQCLYEIPTSIGCNIKFLNLLESKSWRLDLKKLNKLVTPKTKLIIINNPHNPIGFTLNEKELYEIGEIAKKMIVIYCLTNIIDTIHCIKVMI